jgi:hypothetical protein
MKTKLTLSLFTRFRIYVSNLWFKYVKNPFYYRLIVEPKAKREKEKKRKEIIKNFEVNQKTLQSRVKEIMYHEKVYCENNPKLDYLNQKLVEGREHTIQISPAMKRIPFLYEPDVVEIHNENYHNNKFTLSEILKKNSEASKNALKQQAEKHGCFFMGNTNQITSPRVTTINPKEKTSTIENLVLNDIRKIKTDEARVRFARLEEDLKAMNVAKMFEDEPMDGVVFPTDINIDDFPTIKKILGKDKK